MTLIVEDGTGVANADTFVSAADHVTYCALYGETVTSQQAEINIRKFIDYMLTLKYKGTKTYANTINILPFPRENLHIDCELLASDEVPLGIIKALNEGARAIGNGYDPLGVEERAIKTETFDVFSTTYMDNSNSIDVNPRVDIFLEPFLLYTGSLVNFKVETDVERCVKNYYGDCYE